MSPRERPNPLRILLVEDSEADARAVQALAQRAGIDDRLEWIHALSPSAALQILRREGRAWRNRGPIHALLVDQYMGVESGIDLLREIKSDLLLGGACVALLSSSDDLDTIEEAYTAGAAAWLCKVGDREAYQAAITNLLTLWLDSIELVEI